MRATGEPHYRAFRRSSPCTCRQAREPLSETSREGATSCDKRPTPLVLWCEARHFPYQYPHPARRIGHHMKRIVITGMGAVTPLGVGVDTYWKRLVSGMSGVRALTPLRCERACLPGGPPKCPPARKTPKAASTPTISSSRASRSAWSASFISRSPPPRKRSPRRAGSRKRMRSAKRPPPSSPPASAAFRP